MKSKKEKIKRKADKVKSKLKRKKVSKRAKIGGVALSLLALIMLMGCSTQPSRTNNQTLRDCYVHIQINGSGVGDATDVVPFGGDVLTQNMIVENSGTETTSPSHSVSPNVPINVPVGLGGGESLGVLGSLVERIFGSKAGASVADAACVGADCAETGD